MDLLIFRHAEKEHTFEADPGLSDKGLIQAQKIKQQVIDKQIPIPQKIWVSPRRRAQETLFPISNEIGLPMTINSNLDQRTHSETGRDFSSRIQLVIQDLQNLFQSESHSNNNNNNNNNSYNNSNSSSNCNSGSGRNNFSTSCSNRNSSHSIFICTHSDWIEDLSTCAPFENPLDFHTFLMPSGSYLHFQISPTGKWIFKTKKTF